MTILDLLGVCTDPWVHADILQLYSTAQMSYMEKELQGRPGRRALLEGQKILARLGLVGRPSLANPSDTLREKAPYILLKSLFPFRTTRFVVENLGQEDMESLYHALQVEGTRETLKVLDLLQETVRRIEQEVWVAAIRERFSNYDPLSPNFVRPDWVR